MTGTGHGTGQEGRAESELLVGQGEEAGGTDALHGQAWVGPMVQEQLECVRPPTERMVHHVGHADGAPGPGVAPLGGGARLPWGWGQRWESEPCGTVGPKPGGRLGTEGRRVL